MKLRLLLTQKCNRSCVGCCNKDYNLDELPIELDFKDYECIMITGGEPMLDPEYLKRAITSIRRLTDTPIYVYTAKTDDYDALTEVLDMVDGLTITIHEPDDKIYFLRFNTFMHQYKKKKSMRLNVFENTQFPYSVLNGSVWKIKPEMVWLEHCPLPDDEVFHQYTPYMDLD